MSEWGKSIIRSIILRTHLTPSHSEIGNLIILLSNFITPKYSHPQFYTPKNIFDTLAWCARSIIKIPNFFMVTMMVPKVCYWYRLTVKNPCMCLFICIISLFLVICPNFSLYPQMQIRYKNFRWPAWERKFFPNPFYTNLQKPLLGLTKCFGLALFSSIL